MLGKASNDCALEGTAIGVGVRVALRGHQVLGHAAPVRHHPKVHGGPKPTQAHHVDDGTGLSRVAPRHAVEGDGSRVFLVRRPARLTGVRIRARKVVGRQLKLPIACSRQRQPLRHEVELSIPIFVTDEARTPPHQHGIVTEAIVVALIRFGPMRHRARCKIVELAGRKGGHALERRGVVQVLQAEFEYVHRGADLTRSATISGRAGWVEAERCVTQLAGLQRRAPRPVRRIA